MPGNDNAILQGIRNPDAGMLVDLDHDSPHMVVVFGGLRRAFGAPPFELFRTISRLGLKAAFVRDSAQRTSTTGPTTNSTALTRSGSVT